MATSNSSPSPTGQQATTNASVQLITKQLGAAVDAFRSARMQFAQTLGELAVRDGFFQTTLPSLACASANGSGTPATNRDLCGPLVDLLRPLLTSEPSAGVQAAAVSALARIMQAAATGNLSGDKKTARARMWAECISEAKGVLKALVGVVEGAAAGHEDPLRRTGSRTHAEDQAATLVCPCLVSCLPKSN
jgi:hypothetical protein